VEGTIELREHSLVVGPNGRIHANISAREVILHGKVEGNIQASERVELKKSCVVVGDITTHRISIEDGAFFKGAVDLQKESKPETGSPTRASRGGVEEPRRNMAASAAASSSYSSTPSTPVAGPQTSLLEHN
jgi:cytoskeletal protein CcmA (bactofilin family)